MSEKIQLRKKIPKWCNFGKEQKSELNDWVVKKILSYILIWLAFCLKENCEKDTPTMELPIYFSHLREDARLPGSNTNDQQEGLADPV